MEKMTGKSLDLVAENVEQLKRLFPEAVTEGKIDFEVLKNMLGGEIEDRQEYYKFTWNGKEAARAYARVPSMGTLRPCVEESSGKDGTPGKFDSENLYIEGDNLEVLKLLQGPYHKRIKMIYIDPPYNTGHDFVYPDNYRDSLGNYKSLTGQTNEEGKATRANPETSGRYHTDWLNMMYPRLILARNLLTEDGVIFISIDDSEQDNLKKLCNEVFGEENLVAEIPWQSRASIQNDTDFSVNHEYLVVFAKNRRMENRRLKECNAESWYKHDTFVCRPLPLDKDKYENPDNDPRGPWKADPFDAPNIRPNLTYPIVNPNTNEKHLPPNGRCWRYLQETYFQCLADNRIVWTCNGRGRPQLKVFYDEKKDFGSVDNSWFSAERIGTSTNGTKELLNIFDGKNLFDTPKPTSLLSKLLYLANLQEDSVVLDFFSGSATTAHAVLQLNAEDGGNRKFIMVQLPEVCEDDSEAAKAGYKNICEIGKERIRRAAKKIKEEKPLFAGDMGFKVFKQDDSNFVPWNPKVDELRENLLAAVNNVLVGRSTDDLLYEVLLKCNLPLTLPIEENKFGQNTVYIVGAGALAICLDQSIPQTIAEEIVKLRDKYAPIVPMQVVFRDNGFTDVAKTNALQILKQAGFEEKAVRTL